MNVLAQVSDYSRLPASWADALPPTLDMDGLYASVDALYLASIHRCSEVLSGCHDTEMPL